MVIHTAFAPEQNAQLSAATDKARLQKLSLLEVLQLAEQWGDAGQAALAAELYKTWTAFNDQSPLLHLAFFNYSVILKQLGDTAGAINALRATGREAEAEAEDEVKAYLAGANLYLIKPIRPEQLLEFASLLVGGVACAAHSGLAPLHQPAGLQALAGQRTTRNGTGSLR